MPMVNGKKFAYTKAGVAKAKVAATAKGFKRAAKTAKKK